MVLHINCAIHALGIKFGHAPGVDSLHRLTTIGKPSNSLLMQVKLPDQVSVYSAIGLLVPISCPTSFTYRLRIMCTISFDGFQVVTFPVTILWATVVTRGTVNNVMICTFRSTV